MTKGTCHRCGRKAELDVCPFDSELYDDYTEQCCADCQGECAMDV